MRNKVTIKDVAKRAGVSPTTVSRVLNGAAEKHLSPTTYFRVLQAISELGYVPDKAARVLRWQRTKTIAVLLPDISNPFFALLARGVEAVAFSFGYSTLICDSNNSLEKELKYMDLILYENVEGFVFIPVGKPSMQKLQRLLQHGIKIVVADRRIEGFPCIEADNFAGSVSLAEYLISLGYNKIVYIAGPREVSTADDRLMGFVSVIEKNNLKDIEIYFGDFSFEYGYKIARSILFNKKVELIMCANDLMALGVLYAAREKGISVPDDLGIAGFDHIPVADLVYPRLTTVHVPAFDIGQTAAQQLFSSQCAGVKLGVAIIPGGTCAPRG